MKDADNLKPAIFLDRDGTIIDDCGHLSDPSQVVFYKETVPALQQLQKHFALFIVTNQCGVARGIISLEDVTRVNAYVEAVLAESGIHIEETYVCPHDRSDGCNCIKPKPYFLEQAAKNYGIDLKQSFVLGDHPHDVEFAESVEAHGIYLLSGHGTRHRPELPDNVTIASGIQEAAQLILENTELPYGSLTSNES